MTVVRHDGEVDLQTMTDIAKARILILSDGRKGAENRSLGVAEMLGIQDRPHLGTRNHAQLA